MFAANSLKLLAIHDLTVNDFSRLAFSTVGLFVGSSSTDCTLPETVVINLVIELEGYYSQNEYFN